MKDKIHVDQSRTFPVNSVLSLWMTSLHYVSVANVLASEGVPSERGEPTLN